MDNFPDEQLNNLNSSKVAKLNSIDEKMSKNLEESANIQSNSTKQLPDKIIFGSLQTPAKHLPYTFLNESILNINTSTAINSPIKDGNSHTSIFSLPTLNQERDNKPFIFGAPKVNIETRQFTFTLKSEDQKNSRSPSMGKKPTDGDESLTSILLCIENLNLIISEAKKSKVIGIFDSSECNNTNTIKSALLQLRLAPDKGSWVNKCVFVNNNVPASDFIIKEHILCDNEYDAQRYHSAIALSCLREDLKSLPNGDQTVIGKNGLQLTDAQKEKLAFARAFYANKDIYFFYDILNSVDETTEEYIFETLIKGALEEKIVILITHNPMCLSRCDEIYVIKNGEINAKGDHQSLLETNEYYASMIKASTDNAFNKNVKISMKDELNSSEKSKDESHTFWLNIKVLVIYFAIILSMLLTFLHVSMEQFCSYIMSKIMKIMEAFDAM